jgi:pimeloyl-ACP methyl ester carboxylesterase
MHGVTSSASTWKPFLDSLPKSTAGIAFDAIGHGWTERHGERRPITAQDRLDQLLELVDALEVERMWLVGHSMGCGAALRLAWQQPARVAALLLCSPAALGRRKLGPTIRLARNRLTARLLEAIAPLTVPRMAKARVRAAAGREPDDDLLEREAGHAIARPREVTRGFVDVVGHGDIRRGAVDTDRWARIEAPVWIVRGGKDLDWMPESHEDGYQRLLPGARVERWEGAGHSPHIEEPDRFRRLLLAFLAEMGASRAD